MNRSLAFFIFFLSYVSTIIADGIDPIFFPKAEVLNKYTTRIPFKLIDHLIVVEAELLNKRGNFIIDTGSESLILNKAHFPLNHPFNKKAVSSSGIIKEIDNPFEKRLKDFTLQNLTLKNKSSDVIDLSHIEKIKKIRLLGIIGYNILKDYEVFIDLHLNQLTLTKVDKKGNKLSDKVYAEKIADSLDFKLKKHTIVISAFINNQKLKFALDSGAEYNLLSKNVNKKVLKFFIPRKRLKLNGVGQKKIEVMAGNLHRVKLSETIYFGPMYTMLSNLTKLNDAFGTELDGVVGYEFLEQKRTIINYKKQKLYFIDYPRNRQ